MKFSITLQELEELVSVCESVRTESAEAQEKQWRPKRGSISLPSLMEKIEIQ